MGTRLKDELYQALLTYQPTCEQEVSDQKVFLAYMEQFPNIYDRENSFAHITSSPWIVNKTRDKVLMIYHNIYRSWGWTGGHCDGDRDTLHVALKEGMEETGLQELQPLCLDILAIDVLPVPPHVKGAGFVSAHVHLNVTYACIADDQALLKSKPDENSGVAWIDIDRINEFVTEEDMKPVYAKLVDKINHVSCMP